MANLTRIDVHAHFLPNFYREALIEAGITRPDGMPAIPPWSEESHIEFMKNAGISKSYLSISSPGVHFGRDSSKIKALTRRVNEHAASLVQRHPDKFGSFASLPFPNVDACLEEIAFALDDLNADGITMLTNYDGLYLGDKTFDPVFKELNRRGAKIFLHPTTGCQCVHGQPQPFRPLDYPSPMMEFFFDAARAVVNLILSGTVTSYPNITFIIPHCGGVLPPLIDRFSSFSARILKSCGGPNVSIDEIRDILRNRFYYDLAGFSMSNQIHGLLRWTGPTQLLYGSDYPFTPADGAKFLATVMDKESKELWKEEEIRKVFYENAERFFSLPHNHSGTSSKLS